MVTSDDRVVDLCSFCQSAIVTVSALFLLLCLPPPKVFRLLIIRIFFGLGDALSYISMRG